ncbi:MAG: SDR family NAD(P)-dependent oxidoreductase [Labilithrix sp.]|nr:SDR family NAD(P)-dependent oxidoreductase [Labilithrix sp.]MCW5813903.1 SDR family NAD(P)-dependent oxidoreductase [Labilithrix sp.]
MKTLAGKVAIIEGGGGPIGRAVALALAARGASVVVCGPEERALGETVGEIAYGGGKARHVVGDLAAATARAAEVFGPVDVAIATRADCTLPDVARTVVVAATATPAGKTNAVVPGPDVDPDDVAELVAFVCAARMKGRRIALDT